MSEYIYEKITENEPIRICEVTAAVHADGDGAFFAQNATRDPGEFNSKLNELAEAGHFEKLRISSTGETERPPVGMHIVAQFNEDQMWYRAEVIKSNPRGIKIAFIDYGNTEDITTSELQDCVRKVSPEVCTEPAFAYRIRDNTLYDNPNAETVMDNVYGALSNHYGEECDLAVLDVLRLIPSEGKQETRYASSTDFWGDIQCRLGEGFKWVGLAEVAEHGLEIMNQKEDQTILQPVSPSVPSESIQTNFENSMTPIGQPRANGSHEQSTFDETPSVFKPRSDAIECNRIKVWISECSNGVLCLLPDAGEQFEASMHAYHHQLTEQAPTFPPHQRLEIGACGIGNFDEAWYRAVIIETEPVPKAFFVDYGNSAEIEKGRFLQSPAIFQQNLFAYTVQVPRHLEDGINSLGAQSMENEGRWQFWLEISKIQMHDSWNVPMIVGTVYVQDQDLPEKRLEDYLNRPEEVTISPDASKIEPPSCHSTKMDESTLPVDNDDDVPLSELQVPIPRIPKADVEIGKTYQIFFHEYEGSGKPFFVSTIDDSERHEILETQALTKFDGLQKIAKAELGAACIGRYLGCPFRAEIIRLISPENIELYFVDYGNIQIANIDDVYVLPPEQEYASWPRLGFPIKFNVDFNENQLAKIKEFSDPVIGEAHVIEVKILSVNSELGNGTIEVEVMIDSQPIQDYLTQAEVDQCQSHVDPIEDPDLDPSEEPKALSNIDASMSNIQPNDTTISDPMAKREPFPEHGTTNPTVSVNQKTYNPGQELYLKVMKITKKNGIPQLHGFFLEDEDRIIHMSNEIEDLIQRNSWQSGDKYFFENDQIAPVKTFYFGEEGEFSRGKIIEGANSDEMIIKFIDYELTEPKIARSRVFPYSKTFAGPEWVSGGVLGTIDNIDWSIDGALEEFENLINDLEVEHREPNCVPISIIATKDEGNFFSMHLAPDPNDEDFNKILKKYSPSEKRAVLGEVQNVPECLMPSRSRTPSTKSSQPSVTEQNRGDLDRASVNQSENQAPESINHTKNNDPEWSGKWSISNVNSTAATSVAQNSNTTLENKFDSVIITKVSKKRVQDGSGEAKLYSICSCSKIDSWHDHNRIITEAMKTSMDNHGIGPIETFVDVGRQVIVRDKTFHQDANDAGFRRAVACNVADEDYQLFKLIDTEKTIGLKMRGSTRVYPSPSILSDIKSIREEIIIEESLGVKEGDQIRFSPKFEAPGRPGAWFGDVIADIKIPQLVQMMTDIQEKLQASGDGLNQQKLGLIKSKLSSINDLLQ